MLSTYRFDYEFAVVMPVRLELVATMLINNYLSRGPLIDYLFLCSMPLYSIFLGIFLPKSSTQPSLGFLLESLCIWASQGVSFFGSSVKSANFTQ